MKKHIIPLLLTLCLIVPLLCGCSTIQKIYDCITAEDTPAETSPDGVEYSALNWTMGGFNGAAAVYDPNVQITNLVMSANRMSYSWVTPAGFAAWGSSDPHDSSRSLVCAFVKDSAGRWVGGKFDWISTDRLFRDLDHLYNYNGWTLANIPNPTEICFVFVEWQGQNRRSNVLGPAPWQR